jgi:hypothetical protein
VSHGHAIIIASEDDLHARVVAWELSNRNVGSTTINLEDLPASLALSHALGGGTDGGYRLSLPDGRNLTADQISGIWWRRTHPFRVPDDVEDKDERRFCYRETQVLLDGWMHALGRKLVNPFAVEMICRNKPYQLTMAEQAGLDVPATLISNDPAEVRTFHEDHDGAVIFKTLSNNPGMETPFTRSLSKQTLSKLEALRCGPALFQKKITGGSDIRITVVDERAFAAEIAVSAPQAAVDWRIDPNSRTLPHTLPKDFEADLIAFHRKLGLRYGAYDFRTDAQGTYWFLEVNTGGQYLWLETEAGLPISAALADALIADTA